MSDVACKSVAELVGTFILVFPGVGSAVVGIDVIGGIGMGLLSASCCSPWRTP
jgi:glycerol uptake facilitator-like aquaporin